MHNHLVQEYHRLRSQYLSFLIRSHKVPRPAYHVCHLCRLHYLRSLADFVKVMNLLKGNLLMIMLTNIRTKARPSRHSNISVTNLTDLQASVAYEAPVAVARKIRSWQVLWLYMAMTSSCLGTEGLVSFIGNIAENWKKAFHTKVMGATNKRDHSHCRSL